MKKTIRRILKKRILVALIILLFCGIIVGFGKKKTVDLLEPDKKLIDLGKSIERTSPGNQGNTSPQTPSVTPSVTKAVAKPTKEVQKQVSIEIRIRDKAIEYTINGEIQSGVDVESLKSNIIKQNGHNTKLDIKLIDDYAESKTYKSVKSILDELKNEKGLTYKEEVK